MDAAAAAAGWQGGWKEGDGTQQVTLTRGLLSVTPSLNACSKLRGFGLNGTLASWPSLASLSTVRVL